MEQNKWAVRAFSAADGRIYLVDLGAFVEDARQGDVLTNISLDQLIRRPGVNDQ